MPKIPQNSSYFSVLCNNWQNTPSYTHTCQKHTAIKQLLRLMPLPLKVPMEVFICVCVSVLTCISMCRNCLCRNWGSSPHSGLPLSHWWRNKPCQGERLVDSAALVRLTARINLDCEKKRQGCNYTETEGQRDGSLFATAWTLLLSQDENGIYWPQRKETALHFCPFVSRHVPSLCHPTCSHTLLLRPHFFQDTSFLLLMATLLSNLSYSSSYPKVSGSLTWTQRRDNLAETDDKRLFTYRKRKSIHF